MKEREQLFEGRAADVVEEELKLRLTAAAESLNEAATKKAEADRQQVAANSELSTRSQAAQVTIAEQATAEFARQFWLEAFIARTSKPLTLEELDAILARDDAWIQAEHVALKQLDDAVTNAEGACEVYVTQLQQHVETQPTQ